MKGDAEMAAIPPAYTKHDLDAACEAGYRAHKAVKDSGGRLVDAEVAWSKACVAWLDRVDPLAKFRCYVYLSFWGIDGVASFLKVGMSKDPNFRVIGLSTGNPLDFLWGYAMAFPSRKDAIACERAIHARMRSQWQRGEWFRVENASAEGARQLAVHELNQFNCEYGIFQIKGGL